MCAKGLWHGSVWSKMLLTPERESVRGRDAGVDFGWVSKGTTGSPSAGARLLPWTYPGWGQSLCRKLPAWQTSRLPGPGAMWEGGPSRCWLAKASGSPGKGQPGLAQS